ncbi:MAG: 4Fe-4S binding protein [Elusimicrobia bacterium]|nr:4Fe-4S binding protein [Elusimicrobiota bacterium]
MATIVIDHKLCKKCGICAVFCPKKIYSFSALDGLKVVKEKECTACDMCVIMCPDFAIKILKEKV